MVKNQIRKALSFYRPDADAIAAGDNGTDLISKRDPSKFWAGIVDGFRCDVASFVPLEFWRAALEAVLKKHLKEKEVDLVMQAYIWRNITIQELAAKEGIEANTMSKRARRALNKVKALWDAGKLFT